MSFTDAYRNIVSQLNRKVSTKHRTKIRKGIRHGREETLHFQNAFSGIYSSLMNIKSEISPMPLERNAYKLKSKNKNYADQSGP